jgi:hypothetical protein
VGKDPILLITGDLKYAGDFFKVVFEENTNFSILKRSGIFRLQKI